MIPRPPAHSPALGPGVVGPLASHPQEGAVATAAQKHTAIQPNDSCEPFVVDPRAAAHSADHPRKHTQSPIVTGTSVIGVKYAGGVLVACDTLGSYGSTKRYKSVQRIYQVNSCCVVAASGELSDFNYIKTLLDEMDAIDYCSDDGMFLSPKEVHAYLTRVLYNRRNKFDPLWNSVVVGGVEDGKPFLGMVSMIGIQYKDIHIGTGFGLHLGVPILRDRVPEDCPEETARAALLDALRVCYYRDKQCMNKFQIAKVDASSGVSISQPEALETKWDYEKFQDPTLFSIGAW